MKVTKYFQFRRSLPDRGAIQDEWIREVIRNPSRRTTQDDGRIRLWGKIAEAGNRYHRVILLEDGKTLHNAFFDRKFKE
jgi:hypothetical protein